MRRHPFMFGLAAVALAAAACGGGALIPVARGEPGDGAASQSGTAERRSQGLSAPVPQSAPGGTDPGQSGNVLGFRFQSDRVLILTADLELRAQDPWAAADRVQVITAALGGDVVGVSQSGRGDELRATVTIRVPNDRFGDALAQIKGLAEEVVTAQVKGEDKTEQFIDLEARLKAKQLEEQRYLSLLARADKIDDILKIDQVLASVRSQIEQLTGQLNALKNRSVMATVTVSISPLSASLSSSSWNASKTFRASTAALLGFLQVFADLAIWGLVWLWLPLLVVGLGAALARARPRAVRT